MGFFQPSLAMAVSNFKTEEQQKFGSKMNPSVSCLCRWQRDTGGVDSCPVSHQKRRLSHQHHSQSNSSGLQPCPPCSAGNDGLETFYPHLEAQKMKFWEADVLAGELRVELYPPQPWNSWLCHQGAEGGGSRVHGEPGTASPPLTARVQQQEFPDQAPPAQL